MTALVYSYRRSAIWKRRCRPITSGTNKYEGEESRSSEKLKSKRAIKMAILHLRAAFLSACVNRPHKFSQLPLIRVRRNFSFPAITMRIELREKAFYARISGMEFNCWWKGRIRCDGDSVHARSLATLDQHSIHPNSHSGCDFWLDLFYCFT